MPAPINTTTGMQEWIMLLRLSLLWGWSFFFIDVAKRDFAPLTIVALRVNTGAIALWLIVLAMGYRHPEAWRSD